MLCSSKNYNLLFLAAEAGRWRIVEFLLNHFDVNEMIDGVHAIDLAYKIKNYDTILVLLKGNSKFPAEFIENMAEFPFDLRKFIITSKSMHSAILLKDVQEVLHILVQNPKLKHFYDVKNQSAYALALKQRAFDVYKLLIDKKLSHGPHESFEDIIGTFTSEEREELREINHKNCQNLKEDYILKLLTNSTVGPDDEHKEARFSHVMDAFECLNKFEEIKVLLKFVADVGNFELIFDFNRGHVQFLDPKSESYMTGLFYGNGRIYIGAMHLLNKEKAHEVR